jgi:hypothetical protein
MIGQCLFLIAVGQHDVFRAALVGPLPEEPIADVSCVVLWVQRPDKIFMEMHINTILIYEFIPSFVFLVVPLLVQSIIDFQFYEVLAVDVWYGIFMAVVLGHLPISVHHDEKRLISSFFQTSLYSQFL